MSTNLHFWERHCENLKKERPWRIFVLIFSCIDERLVVKLMTPSNLVWAFFCIIGFSFLTLTIEELRVVPLVRYCPYLRVVYVHIHMQQWVSTISFLHIRTSACVRVSLSVLEFRESVTSRKILCKFQAIRRNSLLSSVASIDACLFPTYEITSCLCHFLDKNLVWGSSLWREVSLWLNFFTSTSCCSSCWGSETVTT